jgi:hypothetical protein
MLQIPPIGTVGAMMIAIIILASLFGIALVPAREYARAARWHDLRVRCQRLRRERLMSILENAEVEDAAPGAKDIAAVGAATRPPEDENEDQDGNESAQNAGPGVAGRIGGSGSSAGTPVRARAA